MTKIVLNMNKFEYFFNYMGPAQPGLLVLFFSSQMYEVCVYPFSRERGINLFGDHRGSILSNRAEISQEG